MSKSTFRPTRNLFLCVSDAKVGHNLAISYDSQKTPKSRKNFQRNILITPNKSTFRDDKQG